MPAERYSNQQLAEIFQTIGNLLEIKGEVIYKILAYRKAADSLSMLSRGAYDYWQEGKLTEIDGVGKAIAEKIDELFTTGRLEFLDKLTAEVPASLADLLQVPDLGPKKIALFWRELGIIDLSGLEAAARAGKLRSLPGMGEKSEAKIIAGIESLSRRTTRTPLGKAWPAAQQMLDVLRTAPGVVAAEAAGSLRRMRETVGDIDLLVAAKDSAPVMQAFTKLPGVLRVLGSGETKSSVEFNDGLRAQLWVHPPERFGTALQYATGSKDHNVRLRELALKQKLSLSDQAFTREDGSELLCSTEEEVYTTLGLPWIPPELRENRGEIEAARAGKLPKLVELKELRGDLHVHTKATDGHNTLSEMAAAARAHGLDYIAITEHSRRLTVAHGLDVKRLRQQMQAIDKLNAQLKDITLLKGIEVDILEDGSLDLPDDVLGELDIVVGAVHSQFKLARSKQTTRILKAMDHPHFTVLAHPSGRLIDQREPYDVDMLKIIRKARERGCFLELNAHPERLDLLDSHCQMAKEEGVLIAISSDAHSTQDFDNLYYGVGQARRGWLEKKDVLNSRSLKELRGLLKKTM